MTKIHPLARKHLLDNQCTVSGMPEKTWHTEKNCILDSNINYYADSPYQHYPLDDNPQLSETYIHFLKQEHCCKQGDVSSLSFLTPSHLLFISASTAIDLLIRTFCEPALDKVCIFSPTFPLYAYCSLCQNTPVIDIPLIGRHYDRINTEKVSVESPKLLFIPSPNNPVGSIPCAEDILALLQNTQSIVVIDEAYIEYADHLSFTPYIDAFPNLVILRSFSKIWGLAGIRCGVVLGDPMTIHTLKKLLTPYNFPAHTQEILKGSLNQMQNILEIRSIAKKDMQYLTEQMQALSICLHVYPSETNFVLVQFTNAKQVFHELYSLGFLVKDTSRVVPNTLRISLGTTQNNERFIAALQHIDKKLSITTQPKL
ncbi:MAG: aminotransferase class I/II-fold pyridoxal phosphate-dependent enzyme [Simkania sp.]|nr:aminotransferase class I/II-fold pyridoxal phosphate-dependent enzyme [Simkania sp.]